MKFTKRNLVDSVHIDNSELSDNRQIYSRLITYGEYSRNGWTYLDGSFDGTNLNTVPVYDRHNTWSNDYLIGSATIEKVKDGLMCKIQLNDDTFERATDVWNRVKNGNIQHVSLG